MESRLDEVEAGRVEWTQMMEAFYPSLLEWIDHARETADVAWVKRCLRRSRMFSHGPNRVKTKRTYDDYKTFTDVKATTEEGELLQSDRGEMLLKCVVATIIKSRVGLFLSCS